MLTKDNQVLLGFVIGMLAYKIFGTPIHSLGETFIDLIALAEMILEAARRK